MWTTAFRDSTQLVTNALLRKSLLPKGTNAFEKVSAAVAIRTALHAQASEQTLLFLAPEPTANTAMRVTAGLLVGNHAHTNGNGHVPPAEARPLFGGDVLLVTPAVSECRAELEELPISGPYCRLKDLWEVVPLSKYTRARTGKPRVFLANPGWMMTSAVGKRFGAVVVDASHPRTFRRLPEILRIARSYSALRLVVSPPLGDLSLREYTEADQALVWVWDPQAMSDAQDVVEHRDNTVHACGDRYLWVCDSDAEASAALDQFHRQLICAARAAGGTPYPGLQLCWSVYNRLRQLAVPLAQLEQATSHTWLGSIRERLVAIAGTSGHGDVAWDTTWPALVDALKSAYETMLRREETAKFWALASHIEGHVTARGSSLRVVVAIEKEADLLLQMLAQVITGISDATAEGRLEIVTGATEARLVAEGRLSPTALLGPRISGRRYLDIFASQRIDEFVYPHEVEPERLALARLYSKLLEVTRDESRARFLRRLGLVSLATVGPPSSYPQPSISIGKANGQSVRVAMTSAVSHSLDIDSLTECLDNFGDEGDFSLLRHPTIASDGDDMVEITFTTGDREHYSPGQNLDVYFSETEVVQRHPASSLRAGWHVISFVDGRYDGLFRRLTEVVNSRLPTQERIALELWQTAKDDLLSRDGSKRALYETLRARGLKSSYATFTAWFNGEDGILAPQQFVEFEVLAKACETYSAPALLKATFAAVQHARGRNRASGKLLRSFLRAVVSGSGYDEALESARKLGTALGDVLAAVEVLEVKSVSFGQRDG